MKGTFVRSQSEALAENLPYGRPDDCWHWTGQIMRNGYGRLYGDGHHEYVHVAAYRQAHGEIPAGHDVDHLCHTQSCKATDQDCLHRRCANPAHLAAVTHRANTLRGNSPTAYNAVKERCPQGHAYDEENTQWLYGKRRCRQCNLDRMRASYVPVIEPKPRRTRHSKTDCGNGHAKTPENTGVLTSGKRFCRPCLMARQIAYRERVARQRQPENSRMS